MEQRHAKFLIGHTANSTMFERVYDQSHEDLNMTGGVLGAEEARDLVLKSISLRRYVRLVYRNGGC
jgi:hypothetical protein